MKLLGVSGTNGGGKDSLAELLRDKYRYFFVSVTEILREEAHNRGLSTERSVLRGISAEWRRESGLGVLVDKAVESYKKNGGDDKYAGLVVSSLRNPGEAETVHKHGGKVVWVDADSRIRYDRIFSRGRADDNKTFEEFHQEELAELKYSGDKATLSMQGVKELSDLNLVNNGNTLTELESDISAQLGNYL